MTEFTVIATFETIHAAADTARAEGVEGRTVRNDCRLFERGGLGAESRRVFHVQKADGRKLFLREVIREDGNPVLSEVFHGLGSCCHSGPSAVWELHGDTLKRYGVTIQKTPKGWANFAAFLRSVAETGEFFAGDPSIGAF